MLQYKPLRLIFYYLRSLLRRLGDVFGELAVLNGKPRSATVKTETETTILELSKEDFLQLVTGKVRKTLEQQVSKMYRSPAQSKAFTRSVPESTVLNPNQCKETVIINTDELSKKKKELMSRAKLMQELHPALVAMLTKSDENNMSPMLQGLAGGAPMLISRRTTKLPSIAAKYAHDGAK
jgi:CRP-like cAMP-binding protein